LFFVELGVACQFVSVDPEPKFVRRVLEFTREPVMESKLRGMFWNGGMAPFAEEHGVPSVSWPHGLCMFLFSFHKQRIRKAGKSSRTNSSFQFELLV
jgi:hypothetical protein